MFFNGAQTIVKHYRACNAARADFGSDRLELQVRKEGMKRLTQTGGARVTVVGGLRF